MEGIKKEEGRLSFTTTDKRQILEKRKRKK
jgi:hypothetical protein